MAENLLIVHGGGPTAVLNASLYGAVMEAKESGKLQHIYGADNGTGGFLEEKLIELEKIPQEKLDLLLQTPGTAIGTSRDPIWQEDYEKLADIAEKRQIKYILFNGGNGTMDTCGKLHETCVRRNLDVRVMGIPKTTDNDIAVTDHSPGFGSAARYIAACTQELCADVRSLPIHVVVMEASGRNAGWITAASALAGEAGYAPDLIYLPERAFDEEKFLADVEKLLKKKSGIVVVASEGLADKEGKPVVKPVFKTDRATYFGDVSSHLANLVIQKLGYKARGEKPGLLGRASIGLQSPVDREEAIRAGREACKAALAGESGKMVAFRRTSDDPYQMETFLADIREVMMYEKKMPDAFINEEGNGVTQEFIQWCRPLIGEELPQMASFNTEKPGRE
ncbi:MAG TPA: diphosphate--fructose-6-phosphate 1-phosphotransferase [Candidatus Blautia merdavium]|uniref:Pyrophosphate--fructose 6-phosphate 1-phosphotransferase n=1 Tax=Candidatus Blautia merdavium TaxID=2838494 RepID=A0A9D2PPY4_9FIRM|nr:diphosphate--fructose-6-phosphate 1-phosphotransferase [Candidatus Blautia merdavium]